MILNFCTLFNYNYLSRGLALYQSLQEHCPNFHLYVFAFDDGTYNYLKNKNIPNLTVISLKEFEDKELLAVKPARNLTEYCWTCTPSTILYCIKKFNLTNCTYVDADIYFYDNPQVLFDEMGNKSVLITEHRYTKEYDQSFESGKYCVQYVTFKNDEQGMETLQWWRKACIDWCYARAENGKFGDQKYLDSWPEQFKGVHVLKNLGGGIAPWNMQQYSFVRSGNKIQGKRKSSEKTFDPVFFHFHGLKFFRNNIVSLTGSLYEMNDDAKVFFFIPYVKQLSKINNSILKNNNLPEPNGVYDNSPSMPLNLLLLIRYYLSDLKISLKNIFGKTIKYRIKHHHFYYLDDIK